MTLSQGQESCAPRVEDLLQRGFDAHAPSSAAGYTHAVVTVAAAETHSLAVAAHFARQATAAVAKPIDASFAAVSAAQRLIDEETAV